jgi:hypothetical protein
MGITYEKNVERGRKTDHDVGYGCETDDNNAGPERLYKP